MLANHYLWTILHSKHYRQCLQIFIYGRCLHSKHYSQFLPNKHLETMFKDDTFTGNVYKVNIYRRCLRRKEVYKRGSVDVDKNEIRNNVY